MTSLGTKAADCKPEYGSSRTKLSDRFSQAKLVGEGHNAWVFHCVDRKTNQEVAVKLQKADAVPGREGLASDVKELECGHKLAQLRIPNVVQLLEAFVFAPEDPETVCIWNEPKYTKRRDIVLIFELYDGGNLEAEAKQVKNAGQHLSGPRAMRLMRCMARAVAGLHAAGYLSNDIALRNFLLRKDEPGAAWLADLGCSKWIGADGVSTSSPTDASGTPIEAKGSHVDETKSVKPHGFKSDVFSLGVAFLQLLTLEFTVYSTFAKGFVLGNDVHDEKQRSEMLSLLPQWFPDQQRPLLSLLESMLHQHESARPSAADVLKALNRISPAVTVDVTAAKEEAASLHSQLDSLVAAEGKAGDDARALVKQVRALLSNGGSAVAGLGEGKAELSVSKVKPTLEQLAQRGDLEAMRLLGRQLCDGTHGRTKDPAAGISWIRRAVSAGHAPALSCLGYATYYGLGVAKDENAAVELVRKAANAGVPMGMFNLAFCLEHGRGVNQDVSAAADWYRKAAEAGEPWGMVHYAICLNDGRGVAKNERAAVELHRKAAGLGDADAMANVGYMFEHGRGVAQDKKAAIEWYTKAANLGSAGAMRNLGVCYYYGRGVAQDKTQALRWLRKSAAAGYADAKRLLETLPFGMRAHIEATVL